MSNTLQRQGDFSMLKTKNGHHVLRLGGDKRDYWIAVVNGEQGDIVVLTDSHHPGSEVVREGGYYYVKFKGDSDFADHPHLFLANRSGGYDEWILPNGLPTGQDKQKKLIRTPHAVARSTIEGHL